MLADDEDTAWQRLDKFLFFARFCKTRAAAGALIGQGVVRINRQVTEKPHARLRLDDIVTLPLLAGVKVFRVKALARRRGPATEARTLYEELA